MISDSTNCAVLLATAKQMPCAPLMIAVLMPITSAADDTSGPPELPGLSAASVWITSSMVRPLTERIERPSADTTPADTFGHADHGVGIGVQQNLVVCRGGFGGRRQIVIGDICGKIQHGEVPSASSDGGREPPVQDARSPRRAGLLGCPPERRRPRPD